MSSLCKQGKPYFFCHGQSIYVVCKPPSIFASKAKLTPSASLLGLLAQHWAGHRRGGRGGGCGEVGRSHIDTNPSGCPVGAIENSHSWENPSYWSSPVFSQALPGITLGSQLPEVLAGGGRASASSASPAHSLLPKVSIALGAGSTGFTFPFWEMQLPGGGSALREAISSQEEPKFSPWRHWEC